MSIKIIEFKARCNDIEEAENRLLSLSPRFIGEDDQSDFYFNVPSGRLKLREGNIENSLIYYDREDRSGAKESNVILYRHSPDKALKDILCKVHGLKVTVIKKRRIYFIDNVKFHFDRVEGLGTFIEAEAIDETGEVGTAALQKQCDHYIRFFTIPPEDFISVSYSDMLLQKINAHC